MGHSRNIWNPKNGDVCTIATGSFTAIAFSELEEMQSQDFLKWWTSLHKNNNLGCPSLTWLVLDVLQKRGLSFWLRKVSRKREPKKQPNHHLPLSALAFTQYPGTKNRAGSPSSASVPSYGGFQKWGLVRFLLINHPAIGVPPWLWKLLYWCVSKYPEIHFYMITFSIRLDILKPPSSGQTQCSSSIIR